MYVIARPPAQTLALCLARTTANLVQCRVVLRKGGEVTCLRRPALAMAPLRGRRRRAAALLQLAADPAEVRAGLGRARAVRRVAACRRSASQRAWMKRYATNPSGRRRMYVYWYPTCVLAWSVRVRQALAASSRLPQYSEALL